jgi:hypothetical protein
MPSFPALDSPLELAHRSGLEDKESITRHIVKAPPANLRKP